ncbi:MAG: alpha/beta fold hydrolase [Gammaproteobacteria bacterium]|nr:alpha/beta fold hydrolase [Gammaproteobacteria bacterium]NIR83995.1 alpha/beta fold hydrolase [Gammaproteobacteria bacterium]NIR89139.1 alpha/beta fold hydrolase [Gammaproteobacteria bacterium]NIU04941.1 alpha/beta fold hydrolase [Gammaproteobacteria bacterium]NIV52107.1 alpha/beta fold hydrolase [Gammaproteobacteria bacterium]
MRSPEREHSELLLSPWRVDASGRESVPVHTDMPFTLERYADGGTGERVLFVPPIINHPWILDLRPEVSVVQRFCQAGFDVYMARWGCDSRKDIGFHDIVAYLRAVSQRIGRASVFGYCTGGIISLLFTALHPRWVNSLTLLATPVDFSMSDIRILWGRWFDVRRLRRWFKNVPGEVINTIGVGLLYYHLPGFLSHHAFVQEITSPEAAVDYWRRLRWVSDAPRIPGKAYEEFIEGCYRGNLLVHNAMRIDGRCVDLSRIDVPILNIMAEYDHIVPTASVTALGSAVASSRYEEIIFPSSHVGLSVSRSAHERLWPRVTQWIAENAPRDRLGRQNATARKAG